MARQIVAAILMHGGHGEKAWHEARGSEHSPGSPCRFAKSPYARDLTIEEFDLHLTVFLDGPFDPRQLAA